MGEEGAVGCSRGNAHCGWGIKHDRGRGDGRREGESRPPTTTSHWWCQKDKNSSDKTGEPPTALLLSFTGVGPRCDLHMIQQSNCNANSANCGSGVGEARVRRGGALRVGPYGSQSTLDGCRPGPGDSVAPSVARRPTRCPRPGMLPLRQGRSGARMTGG